MTAKMKAYEELPSRQLKFWGAKIWKRVIIFFWDFLDEFINAAIVSLDLKCLHVLDIVMKNSGIPVLMRLKGVNVLFWWFLQIQPLCVHICTSALETLVAVAAVSLIIWCLFVLELPANKLQCL